MAYLSREALARLGLAEYGDNVLISEFCSIHGASSIHIASNVRIDDFTVITARERVEIGSHVHIGAHVLISGSHGFRMGDFAGISPRTSIFTSSDDFSGASLTGPTIPDRFRKPDNGQVIVGRHAVVCGHCLVMPGVTIPDGTIVGAMSLVSKSLEPWSIYFGTPARFVRPREKGLLDLERELLEIEALQRVSSETR